MIVIGDVSTPEGSSVELASRIWDDLGEASGLRLLDLIEDQLQVHTKVSRIWGESKGQATGRDRILVLSRDDGEPRLDDEDIRWDEPYKDGGPDAAHDRLRVKRRQRTPDEPL